MASGSSGSWVDRLSESLRGHEQERVALRPTLPRYEILGELGRGGMGVVYRAWDPQLGREVALKVLLDQGSGSAEARERLLREAQVAARLSHPHIVPVYDTGEWMGQAYLAMQLVEGTTLDKASLEPKALVASLRDAARALDHAHREGVVHRDVKPTNFMVDGRGHVWVTDFGLARRNDVPTRLTLSGVVLGTPAYMSPEQARNRPVDARSDIYSLGATMYDLFSGRPPHSGEDAVSVLLKVSTQDPPAPRTHNGAIPRDLETVILKAMDRDPARRYAAAADLADDLQRVLDGEPVLARRQGPIARARRLVVRHPWHAVAAASLLAFLVAAGVIARDYLAARREHQAGIAELDLERKIARFERAARWIGEAEAALPALRDQRRQQERKPLQKITEDAAARERERESLSGDVERFAGLLDRKSLGDAKALLPSLQSRLARHPDLRHAYADRLRDLELRLAFGEALAGLPSPEPEFRRSFDALDGPAYAGVPGRSRALAELAAARALARAATPDFDGAFGWLGRARSLDAALRFHASHASMALAYASGLAPTWSLEGAPERWKEALDRLDLVIGGLAAAPPKLLVERARLLRRLGRYDLASQALSSPDSPEAHLILGQARYLVSLSGKGDLKGFEAAAGEFDRALKDDPSCAAALYWRGLCHQALDQPATARDDFRQAVERGLDGADLETQLAAACGDLKRWPEAAECATRALAGDRPLGEDEFASRLGEARRLSPRAVAEQIRRDALYTRALARFMQNQLDDCIADATACLKRDTTFAKAWFLRGSACSRARRYAEAVPDLAEAIRLSREAPDKDAAERIRLAEQFKSDCEQKLRK